MARAMLSGATNRHSNVINGLGKQMQVRNPWFLLTHLYRLYRSQKLWPIARQFEALDEVPSFMTQNLPSCWLGKEKCRYWCLWQWGIPPQKWVLHSFFVFGLLHLKKSQCMDLSKTTGDAIAVAKTSSVERRAWNNALHMQKILQSAPPNDS